MHLNISLQTFSHFEKILNIENGGFRFRLDRQVKVTDQLCKTNISSVKLLKSCQQKVGQYK